MASPSSRKRLVDEVRGWGVTDERVLKVLEEVPRHEFVDDAMKSRAYENNALPIGLSQTISQPYIVARMTEAILRDGVPAKVLEIGTGSGYQTAVLAKLVRSVFTIERLRPLSASARARLAKLGFHNILFSYGDGMAGWAAHAPYDAIVVTAAAEKLPDALLKQLAPGGRLVIPLGKSGTQTLKLFQQQQGRMVERELGSVSFVPLLPGKA